VFPADFIISNGENVLVVRATINITYSNTTLPAEVQDTLSLSQSSDRFNATYNPSTSVLIVEAVKPFRFLTTQEQLRDYLMYVTFSTNDQASDVKRTINIVVEEFPLGRGPLVPTSIPVSIETVNDQPIISPTSNVRTMDILMEYLPQETMNLGFNVSFLLHEDDVIDLDRRSRVTEVMIGLAVIETQTSQSSLGEWQYYSSSGWRLFPAVSFCAPMFMSPSDRIRFSSFPNLDKDDGSAVINYLVWDGSSRDSPCSPSSPGGE